MSEVGDTFIVPHSIKAESSDGLRLLCLKNNIKNGKQYQYYQIIFDGKYWYAFYYEQAKEAKLIAKR